jgi:AraC-like DNA-binding protein
MTDLDESMLYIDLDSVPLSLVIDVAVRDVCRLDWSWDHDPVQWALRPPSILAWQVNDGGATLETTVGTFELSRGDVLLMPSRGYTYSGRHSKQCHFDVSWFYFRVEGNERPLGGVAGIPFHCKLTDPAFAEQVMGRLLVSSGPSREMWLRAWLDEVGRQSVQVGHSELGARVRELGARMEAEPGRFHGLDAMLQACPCSKDHLIRLFRKYHGMTPVEFLIQARMTRARVLLASTDFPIKQIAAQLGYADSFCFSRQFKARTGESPTAFRQR